MMSAMLMLLALHQAFALEGQAKAATGENPMRKIITMLQDMAKELEREGEIEKEIFDKALCACEGGDKELQNVIDESTAAIEEWTAKLESMKAENAQLTSEIA